MKALLINGSPHERGCTYTALEELARTLEAEGIETEIVQAGARTTHGCIACGKCRVTGKCVFDDVVNERRPSCWRPTRWSSARRCTTPPLPAAQWRSWTGCFTAPASGT